MYSEAPFLVPSDNRPPSITIGDMWPDGVRVTSVGTPIANSTNQLASDHFNVFYGSRSLYLLFESSSWKAVTHTPGVPRKSAYASVIPHSRPAYRTRRVAVATYRYVDAVITSTGQREGV